MPATGPVSRQRLSVQQTSHALLREVLRGVLLAVIESRQRPDEGIDPDQWRACAVVHQLLSDHPIDRRGRCRSCRRRGDVLGRRRRRCQVHIAAHFYLHQPDDAFLLSHLVGELELADPPPLAVRAAPEPCSASDPERPRSRRGPADDQGPTARGGSMLLTGSATCPA